MTVAQFLNGVIYAGALAAAVTAIIVLLHFALVRPIRSFLRDEITIHLVDIKNAIDDNGHEINNLRARFESHIKDGHSP